jgi:hypothetical protein
MITSPFLEDEPSLIIYGVCNQMKIESKYQNIGLKLALLNSCVLLNQLHIASCFYGFASYINGHNFENETLDKYLKIDEHLMLDLIFP